MGIMSKSNRLPERPKPPSWDAISDDVEGALANDVVYTLGKNYFETLTEGISLSQKSSQHTVSSSDVEILHPDSVQVDGETVKTSLANASRLIALYTELNSSPACLQEQYGNLKHLGDEMAQSMTELKTLAQTFSTDVGSKTTEISLSSGKSSGKGKAKQKKKK